MKRDLVKSLTLQTKTTTDDGLGEVTSWTDGSAYRVTVAPAGVAQIERAQLRSELVTHTGLAPRGLDLQPGDHRFKDGSTIYRIVEVQDTPRATVIGLEAQS